MTDDYLGRVERVLYLAAATDGMRQGELIALRWRDVDWSARRIRVRRNYVRGEYGTPKSKRSSRAVPLIDRLARELERPSRHVAWAGDDDLVFAPPGTGGPLDRSKLLKRFKAACAGRSSAGVGEGGITSTRLRHSFGTAMAAAGRPDADAAGTDGPPGLRHHADLCGLLAERSRGGVGGAGVRRLGPFRGQNSSGTHST